MSERVEELMPVEERAAFMLAPAMESSLPPEWQGARWIGALDMDWLSDHTQLQLLNHAGYHRARLLVRQGRAVRGFVDVEAPVGIVQRGVLDEAVAALPAAAPVAPGEAMPSLTVVVCTRDRSALLRESLTAISQLDYPNFDILVVDNAPRTDETRNMVCVEFNDPRIRLITEPAPGLSRARNAGLRNAQGDIVAFTDDDVVVDEAWLREIAAGFERMPGTACVTGLVPAGELRSPTQGYFDDRVSWSKSVAPRVYSFADPPAGLAKFPFCPGAFGTGANFALHRITALSLGGFDNALGVGTRSGGGEDIDMFTRVIIAGYSLVVQPSAIVWHRHRDGLDELSAQARGYGSGLGAWLAKILLNPQTARLALARIPLVAWSFLQDAGASRRPLAGRSKCRDSWDQQLAHVLRLELYSLARGPLNYLLERCARTARRL
ncbi:MULTISPECIES: glycosyltransferase family 2 protein [unclassified Pseudarthrobacter]|uniref:glycosyltransferase family 2 protein n=1 Tax=unclassified Pseudarthrobacter TaxID=2647000 RepID=UPI0016276287|nr:MULTISPECIES: glycosyltransferase family 2 protein [unclassified Pseudarthrobacter]MBE4718276.1 glycosyl transferase family 2 [Pseudarthrobacter sp. AB1]QNE16228.1 glycosyltransferase [Pseudarthrobacter sp. NBSH8]